MKKFVIGFLSVFSATILALGTTACTRTDTPADDEPTPPAVTVVKQEDVSLDYGDFHTPLQAAYLLSTYTEIAEFATGQEELSRPRALTVTWESAADAEGYYVQLSAQADFERAVTYHTDVNSLDLYNLLLDTDYYWRAAANENELDGAEVNTFKTSAAAPRNLYIDGLTNVRDLGGWDRADGGKVKQGMLYRGGRLNTSSSDSFQLELTEEGRKVFCDELGIKSEIDLRRTDNNEIGSVEDCVVEGVTYYGVPLTYAGDILKSEENVANFALIFDILSKEESYPVYFHCNIGTDRTGLLAFLCNALLGVSEEDLYRDYFFSNFGLIGSARGKDEFDAFKIYYVDKINAQPGATFAQKTENYLVGLGAATAQQIESFRSLLSA